MYSQVMLNSKFVNSDYKWTSQAVYLHQNAQFLYDKVLVRGKLRKALAGFTRRSVKLLDLQSVLRSRRVLGRHYTGIQTVLIEKIKGSESRTEDFDLFFDPLVKRNRSRWLRVAMAYLNQISLQPVELIQVGEIYYVRDGHHRVSVARALGVKYIEAEVVEWEVSATVSGEMPAEKMAPKTELAGQFV